MEAKPGIEWLDESEELADDEQDSRKGHRKHRIIGVR